MGKGICFVYSCVSFFMFFMLWAWDIMTLCVFMFCVYVLVFFDFITFFVVFFFYFICLCFFFILCVVAFFVLGDFVHVLCTANTYRCSFLLLLSYVSVHCFWFLVFYFSFPLVF